MKANQMSKYGRAQRQKKPRRRRRSEYGDFDHKQKIQRRRDAKAKRAEVLKQIMNRVYGRCLESKVRMAVARAGDPFSGYKLVYATSEGIASSVRLGYDGAIEVKKLSPWGELDKDLLFKLEALHWEPLRPKGPLEWLAEAAE